VLLQEERILTHRRVCHDANQDPDARQTCRERDQERQGRAPRQSRIGELVCEGQGRQPDSETHEESAAGDLPSREVPAAQEDEDASERGREREPEEDHVHGEGHRLVDEGEKILLHELPNLRLRERAREEEGGGHDTQGDRVAVFHPSCLPPRPGGCHRTRTDEGSDTYELACGYRPWSGHQPLSTPGPFEANEVFCVECGKDGPTTDGLCAECFTKRHRIVEAPPHIDMPRCPSCGSFRVGPAWIRVDLDQAIPRVLSQAIPVNDPFGEATFRATIRGEDENNYALQVKAHARYETIELTQVFRTRLRLKPVLCDTCTKQRSHYFAGILQVRGTGRDLTPEELRSVRTFVRVRVDRAWEAGEFVSRVDEPRGGLDFYVSTNALGKVLAKELADTFGGSMSTSPKLHGKKGGKDVYRVTSLVRLAPFRVGDVVRYKAREHEVVRIASLVTLRDLISGERQPFKARDLKTARRIDAERVVAEISRDESGGMLAEHPETRAVRPVVTRSATPGRAAVLWTADAVYVSALQADASKS